MKQKHLLSYMCCAEAFAQCSDSQRLKVGCVIVKSSGGIIAEGYNGLPSHLHGPLEDATGATKPQVVHAEANALKKLTRSHESSQGAIMFITHNPCSICTDDIIDAGIKHVYYKSEYRCTAGLDVLMQNGVLVTKLD